MVVVTDLPSDTNTTVRGRAIDLRAHNLDPATVLRALQTPDATRLTIRSSPPGPVHDRVGVIRDDRQYPLRAALAVTARVLGHSAPQDEAIAALRADIKAIAPSPPETTALRRDIATVRPDDAEYEQLAALRGAVEALREHDLNPTPALERFHAAVADLSDRETERIVTEAELEERRQHRRAVRDQLERRLQLIDRAENLERAARKHLAMAIAPMFHRALAAVPGQCTPGPTPGTVDGDPTTAALAVCRIAPLVAPVVVATDRFPTATAATACLDAPVILVKPPDRC